MIWSHVRRMVCGASGRDKIHAVQSVTRTHVGLVRPVNEDRALNRPDLCLWAIADGMGGHGGGDIAAQLTIDALAASADSGCQIDCATIIRSLAHANASIHAGERTGQGRGGTTIAAAWAEADRVHLFWAGDSRIYRIRQGRVELLTKDHSVVQNLVDAGLLAEADARTHPKAHVITRALGAEADVVIEQANVPLMAGDRLLLCSDGVSRTLSERVPRSIPLGKLADAILTDALARDGSDNATIVLVAFP